MRINIKNKQSIGFTLIELMVAVTMISIIALVALSFSSNVSKSLISSRNKSVAMNLIQEKIEELKNTPYDNILITNSVQYRNDFSPAIPYDADYYPPETLVGGKSTFTRYTYIQSADIDNGAMKYSGNLPDSGMKSILVNLVWEYNGETKRIQEKTIVSNLKTAMRRGSLSGFVTRNDNGNPIPGASVIFVENPGLTTSSKVDGLYSKAMLPGTYNVYATAFDYFPTYGIVTVPPNTPATYDFKLTPMEFGSAQGTVWMVDHLVISRIVANHFPNEQWIEIYNPTAITWKKENEITLTYQFKGGPRNILLEITEDILPFQYYLVANLPSVMGGVTSDAVVPLDIMTDASGTVELIQKTNNKVLDRVGWGSAPPSKEGDAISDFLPEEEIIRRTSPAPAAVASNFGPAYDTNDNLKDLLKRSPVTSPRNKTKTESNLISGTPALGALVAANDFHSQTDMVKLAGSGEVGFELTKMATGTWTIVISSVNCSTQIVNVGITPNTMTTIPGPIVLQLGSDHGYIAGTIRDSAGINLNGIKVGAATFETTANGNYFLQVPAGTYEVIVNPNKLVEQWITLSKPNVVVNPGGITTDVNFMLTQGGSIRGLVTQNSFPVPGVTVLAINAGVPVAQAVTDNNGQYILTNLPIGTYTVQPLLENGVMTKPLSQSISVNAVATPVDAAEFALIGAFGKILGNVKKNSTPIKTGVLIVVSRDVLTAGPRDLDRTQAMEAAYYTTISDEEGKFELQARYLDKPYHLYAWIQDKNTRQMLRRHKRIAIMPGKTLYVGDFVW